MSRPGHQIVRRPVLTEKGTILRDTGGHPAKETISEDRLRRKVLFEVAYDANKIEIRKAIEDLFNIKVFKIHTQIVRGKEKRVGRYVGYRSNWKRAIVTLTEGQKLEFFEGV